MAWCYTDNTLSTWLHWPLEYKLTLDDGSRKMITANIWPCVIYWIYLLGCAYLWAFIWVHLGLWCAKHQCWKGNTSYLGLGVSIYMCYWIISSYTPVIVGMELHQGVLHGILKLTRYVCPHHWTILCAGGSHPSQMLPCVCFLDKFVFLAER